MPDYAASLELRIAGLRRKLRDERSNQEMVQREMHNATTEAESLRAEWKQLQQIVDAERNMLKERQAEAASALALSEVHEKEIFDRRVQIAAFKEELRLAIDDVSKRLSLALELGRDDLLVEEQRCSEQWHSDREMHRAKADKLQHAAVEFRKELLASTEEFRNYIRRSAKTQLQGSFERIKHRLKVERQQCDMEKQTAVLAQEREDIRSQRDLQLGQVELDLSNARISARERELYKKAKADAKVQRLYARIAEAEQRVVRSEREASEHELAVREARATSVRLAAKESTAHLAMDEISPKSGGQHRGHSSLTQAVSAPLLQPMLRQSRSGAKAGGLHAEFPCLGALQEVEQNIRLAGSSALPKIGLHH